jgi:hypothetical protein
LRPGSIVFGLLAPDFGDDSFAIIKFIEVLFHPLALPAAVKSKPPCGGFDLV